MANIQVMWETAKLQMWNVKTTDSVVFFFEILQNVKWYQGNTI